MQTEIGNWLLGEVIGEGGMGTVYLAHHKTLGTPAAFKKLAPVLTRESRFRERFVREAKAQAQLRHPGIAQVIDFIEQGESLYLIMEYLSSGSLAQLMEREKGPLPIARSLTWARRALSALDYAHRRGVIHRDVKPSNILFDENGQPKVVDFGIALILDGRRLTTTGTLGTPHYMSPEQIRRPQEVDHRTDVYAMGVVLYEMLAGRAPFDGESDFDIRQAQVNEPPKPLRPLNPEVSEELEVIVLRALAKDPKQRFGGCGEMERSIGMLLEKREEPRTEAEPDLRPGSSLPPLPPAVARPRAPSRRAVLGVCCAALLALVVSLILLVEGLGAKRYDDSDIRERRAAHMAASLGSTKAPYKEFTSFNGSLASRKFDNKTIGLVAGYEYRFEATCGHDCTATHVDLYDSIGRTVRSHDKAPTFEFSPEQSGSFRLTTYMEHCSTSWCSFNVIVSERSIGLKRVKH